MTELFFKGKEFVYNHHLAVPHRPLVADATRSVGAVDLSGNLIVQFVPFPDAPYRIEREANDGA